MLTGEYLVLDGARALALPTKFGQDLVVNPASDKKIHWKSYDADHSVWFEDTIDFSDIRDENDREKQDSVRHTLVTMLREAYLLNRSLIDNSDGYSVTTHLTFPKHWGLGTSSTLINNIAQWLDIDAYTLLKNSFGGSGYDIACAQNDFPLLYRLENGDPVVETAAFRPAFASQLYFVYLNKKQNSRTAIASYYKHREGIDRQVSVIDGITEAILHANTLSDFAELLEKHEATMGDVLDMTPVKHLLFPDFNGTVKSLGAWGGDFVLAISSEDPKTYFAGKGYTTVIPYLDMVL
ncbi:GHMP kinase [Flavobacterium magnum]|uniref:GHMP kinase n=2 Tax=Flavobacterium magnum TaxID=2162713 RepID=A0A2S0RJT5_9FLAO|nr:GHMP kinase [Flavobacterium magnum]